MSEQSQPYAMREPCKRCSYAFGYRVDKNGQDIVRCLKCDVYAYCAPKEETGREKRSITKGRDPLKPSKRAEILMRDGYRCVLCRSPENDNILHVGHLISVDSGLRMGMSEDEVNDDENLAAMCEVCNLGLGSQPIPLRTAIAIVRARITWRNTQGSK
jgi:5-methylcytosine-specific restriction endonuclease McrA